MGSHSINQVGLIDNSKTTSSTVGLIKYDRNELIGEGTFGRVYLGEYNGAKVAVKRVQLTTGESYLTEEEGLQKLDHPNVIKLLHCESDLDFRYYALELCACSMDQLFLPENDPKKYRGPLPSPEDVLIQMFKGLDYIHCDARLVHRDIKPGNVLISLPDQSSSIPVIKWADFGLSKALQGSRMSYTPSEIFRGTYCWLAPEIYKAGRSWDPNYRGSNRSEIFSVACVSFYFLAEGSHPFGPFVNEIIRHHVTADSPIYLHKLGLGHFARDTIVKMLAPIPEDRLTLKEAIHALERIKEKRIDVVPADHDEFKVIDNAAASISFIATNIDDEMDKEIGDIEAQCASMANAQLTAVKIHDILAQKHPEYKWMVVVSLAENDSLVVYEKGSYQQSFIHRNTCGGKYHVMVFRTKLLPKNVPDKDSPSFITTVKGAFNWAQHEGFNTMADVLDEAKNVFTKIHKYYQIIFKTDRPVPWMAGGFSFFKDTIGSYYVYLIEVP